MKRILQSDGKYKWIFEEIVEVEQTKVEPEIKEEKPKKKKKSDEPILEGF